MNEGLTRILIDLAVVALMVFIALVCPWIKRKYDVIMALAADMRVHITRDDERMALLNEALVKLAQESIKVKESAEEVRNLVKTAADGSPEDTMMDQYHSAVRAFKQQGMDDTAAHKLAADSILGGDV